MTARPLYLDVETDGFGGFRPPKQRLVQVAWILAGTAHEARREECYFVRDVGPINPAVPHTITPERCAVEGVSFEEIAAALLDAVRKADVIVAHNAAFDIGTILNEIQVRAADCCSVDVAALRSALGAARTLCTVRAAVDVCRIPRPGGGGRFKFPTLSELHTTLFGYPPAEQLHDALADCRVTERCVRALKASEL